MLKYRKLADFISTTIPLNKMLFPLSQRLLHIFITLLQVYHKYIFMSMILTKFSKFVVHFVKNDIRKADLKWITPNWLWLQQMSKNIHYENHLRTKKQ